MGRCTLITVLILILQSALSAGETAVADDKEYQLWDGKQPVAEYAKQAGLPANKTVDLNGQRLELMLVPAGTFLMGSPLTEKGRSRNEGQHDVVLSEPFYMAKYELTQAQWEAVMGTNPSASKVPDAPVSNVSWDDVQAFLKKAGQRLCLPTEAQWEWACRGGTTTPCFTGESNEDFARAAWFDESPKGSARKAPKPVGQKQPNAFGLFDMHGNVWEWCEDRYAEYPMGPVKDPMVKEGTYWIVRGGCRVNPFRACRSATRNKLPRDYRDDLCGFRVVVPISNKTP